MKISEAGVKARQHLSMQTAPAQILEYMKKNMWPWRGEAERSNASLRQAEKHEDDARSEEDKRAQNADIDRRLEELRKLGIKITVG